MRALVLGGPGFIGVATCRELMRRGVETIAASRSPHPYGTFTSHVTVDRRNEADLTRVLADLRPDILVDLACFQPQEVAAVIRNFTGSRYVFTSTGIYPDNFPDRPAREEDFQPLEGEAPPEPLSYRDGKRWCETLLARSSGFPWTVIRPPAVLGAADPTLRLAAYLERVQDGGPLLVPAESFRRQAGLAWVRDVGYAHALAADPEREANGRAYNISFRGVSLEDLLRAIAAAMGRELTLVPIPFAELPPNASPYGPDPRRSAGYDLTRSEVELGFSPSALEDCLAEVMAWFRAARPSHPGYSERRAELALAARFRSQS